MVDDAEASPWAKIIGPCYTLSSMARALGWTEAAVAAGGESFQLLMLTTDEGVLLFPAFQLKDGAVVDGLTEVLRALNTGVADPWTWAQWLNTSPPDSGLPSGIEMLCEGRITEVIRDAQQDARAWRA
ncbi:MULTISPECIES: hypothetical protein [unclassified Microbacterium]|uniref:hypothetical protein n=1 Tax=unclassified Microbacterium TaxID=2609290 RepID=UPI0025CDFCBA|nr:MULTISPECIES: hypothetical protein [unclassified Microbacterium]